MSAIRCIYEVAPNFPATDQHPDAVRYQIGECWVDAVGGKPTPAEVDALLHPPAPPLDPTVGELVAALKVKGVLTDTDMIGAPLK